MAKALKEIVGDYSFTDCALLDQDHWEENRFCFAGNKSDNSSLDFLQILSKNFYISHQRLSLRSAQVFHLNRSTHIVQMFFVLRGSCELKSNNRTIAILNAMEHAIIFLADDSIMMKVKAGKELEIVDVQIDLDFIGKYLPLKQAQINQLSVAIPDDLGSFNLSVSPQMLSTLYDLLQCEFAGYLKRLYIQAKVMELLILQLVQYDEHDRIGHNKLKRADIDKMQLVHDLIAANPERAYTLASLARAAGTNEHYLKTHFKLLFGKTVFNYLISIRMERARELLLSGDKKISDIANAVGYRYSTHFTQAFKKHFGYLPLKLKGNAGMLLSVCLGFANNAGFQIQFFI